MRKFAKANLLEISEVKHLCYVKGTTLPTVLSNTLEEYTTILNQKKTWN